MIGDSVTDTWKLAYHHHLLSYQQGGMYPIVFCRYPIKVALFLAEKLEARDHVSFDNITVATSISDISMNSFVSKNRKGGGVSRVDDT